jgi:multiple sugar transport system ATP-binding protein
MTVAKNIEFPLEMRKVEKSKRAERVQSVSKLLQIEHLLERKPGQLSGGQRQRVAIGRAIVREPGVFLFDEPLSNLDATLRGQTRIEIARLHKQFATASVVYVTHDQTEAMTLADKIVLLHSGKDTERYGSIAQIGAPLELYHRPNSRFVAGFIGSPRMNFLPGRVTAIDAQGVDVTLDHTNETLRVEVDGSTLQGGQPVTLGVRPEHLELVTDDASRRDATLARTISLIEHLGEHSYVHLEQPGGAVLIAKVPGNARVEQGERVVFAAPARACHLFTEDGFAVKALNSVEHYA